MENWQRAGFGNQYIFRFARAENAMAFLEAAQASLREAGYDPAALAVAAALPLVRASLEHAMMEAQDAGYPLNEGWPTGGEKIL
jgi:hypothetical protein